MAQIKWNDSMSVNNDDIDSQHKEWIRIYNRMDHILLNGGSAKYPNAVADCFIAMQEYARYHFKSEELYMKEIEYPDVVMHKRLHTDFEDQLFIYAKKIRNGHLVLGTEVMSILKSWLMSHILIEDQKYRIYLTETEAIVS